jgi:hypothetical protein
MTGHDYISNTCKAVAEHYGTCTSVALNERYAYHRRCAKPHNLVRDIRNLLQTLSQDSEEDAATRLWTDRPGIEV